VDLVDSLDDAEAGAPEDHREASGREPAPRPHAAPVRFVDYCGFLALDEARHARERLRDAGIRAEILIRDAPPVDAGGPIEEEYWLRVDASRAPEVETLIEAGEA